MKIKKNNNLIFFGPFYPYRGGIAKFNDNLYEELNQKINVIKINYFKLYPKIFYPGKFQKFNNLIDKDQIAHSYNIFYWIKNLSKIIKFKPDIILFPQWNFFLIPFYIFVIIFTKIFVKKKIIFISIVHNIIDHESNFIKKILTKIFYNFSNHNIFHESNGEILLNKILKKSTKSTFINHPVYPVSRTKNILQTKHYKNDTFNFMFYGFIRKYKGLDYLLDAFSKINNKNVRLNILGEIWYKDKKYWENKIHNLNIKNQVNFMSEYTDEEVLLEHMEKSDCFVLPYEKVSSSGVFALAVNYKKPFIMTDIGIFNKINQKYKMGHVFENRNVDKLLNAMLKVIDEKNQNHKYDFDEYIINNKFDNYSKILINLITNINI